MTDEELSISDATLIAWLREADDRGDGDLAMVHCAYAADRIEALLDVRDTLRRLLAKQTARAERLEALLREARSDLAAYVDSDYTEVQRANYPSVERQWQRDMELCRRIDAALKGADHE